MPIGSGGRFTFLLSEVEWLNLPGPSRIALSGGAIASQLHIDSPKFSHTLSGVYLGLFMYLSFWSKDLSIRNFLPLVTRPG